MWRLKHYVRPKLPFAVGFLLISLLHRTSYASFFPLLSSASGGTYKYDLVFSTAGATSSSSPSPELLVSSDFITVYDIAVLGSVTNVSLQGGSETYSLQLLGQSPSSLIGAAGLVDDPSLLNLTVVYQGAFLDHNALVNSVTITIAGAPTRVRAGTFASRDLLVANGADLDQLGPVPVPTLVPEPAMIGLAGVLMCLGLRSARRLSAKQNEIADDAMDSRFFLPVAKRRYLVTGGSP